MKPKQTTIEKLAERIAELEVDNKKLQNAAPFVQPGAVDDQDPRNMAAQHRITQKKNANENLVQLTRAGNVRTTYDPSDTFVAEQSSAAGEPVPGKDTS